MVQYWDILHVAGEELEHYYICTPAYNSYKKYLLEKPCVILYIFSSISYSKYALTMHHFTLFFL